MIGYFRTDDEGNAYVIPEEFVGTFDHYLEYLECLDVGNYDVWNEQNKNAFANPFDLFQRNYEQYIVGNEIHNLKIIMENKDE